jgi:hypothetical protein
VGKRRSKLYRLARIPHRKNFFVAEILLGCHPLTFLAFQDRLNGFVERLQDSEDAPPPTSSIFLFARQERALREGSLSGWEEAVAGSD